MKRRVGKRGEGSSEPPSNKKLTLTGVDGPPEPCAASATDAARGGDEDIGRLLDTPLSVMLYWFSRAEIVDWLLNP